MSASLALARGHRKFLRGVDAVFDWLDDPSSDATVIRVFWLLFGTAFGTLTTWAVMR